MNDTSTLYRSLPQLGQVLSLPEVTALESRYPREMIAAASRRLLSAMRDQIALGGATPAWIADRTAALPAALAAELAQAAQPSLRAVINATGVILHTGLGRAPLSEAALAHIQEVASGYSNLELDLDSGERRRRDAHVEDLLLQLLALRSDQPLGAFAESHRAAIVNNCAAATLLALNTLADGGEVIVSRGELVEIGGGFRIPEILSKSGAQLREVGTTNRTRAADYEAAITSATRLILRVHQSNFRMQGFTERPSLDELVSVAHRHSVPLFEDQGTGCVENLAELGIRGEGSLSQSLGSGPDLVAASGDKLFGGPQCGLLVGRREQIERIRGNPLLRALRVDKLTYAALEATIGDYLFGNPGRIPAIHMLRIPAEAIRLRCESICRDLQSAFACIEVASVESAIGGGTTPGATLPSYAVALRPRDQAASLLARSLRLAQPPIVARIRDDSVLLDLRTVPPHQDAALTNALAGVLKRGWVLADRF